MVPRRRVLVAIGFAIVALCEPSVTAAQKAGGKTRPVTITLKVDGMG
jgi:hypothetical protein